MKLELITFEVAGQLSGIDIMAIREIRAWTPATRLPQLSHYVAGVVNLRGTVLPVIDLAARLGSARLAGHGTYFAPCDHRRAARHRRAR